MSAKQPIYQPGDRVVVSHSGLRARVKAVAGVSHDDERTYEVEMDGGGGIVRESNLTLDTAPPTEPSQNG